MTKIFTNNVTLMSYSKKSTVMIYWNWLEKFHIGQITSVTNTQCENYRNLLATFLAKISWNQSISTKCAQSWFHEIFLSESKFLNFQHCVSNMQVNLMSAISTIDKIWSASFKKSTEASTSTLTPSANLFRRAVKWKEAEGR